ncbi:YqzE family protein [Pseudogracilibacillus auburnensis]|uniref:YqzE-like protein n=1 Tax=Pseudogracilibacillus auburnensis TaxID=1494959 RepID=A0A2V3VFT0_9BACI|nr:YqzE family protein [Pseudogracilibacillus auburnensis]MBO1005845.1 YqzE family protein [Pseudogracilibacillus auburnensis]PXW80034.1 YqzE-like protein [Pseudogracilibacillus auburnensis]
MSHNEYVKFITEQLVTHMNKTKQERKEGKVNKNQSIYSNRWFGLFPFTIRLLFKK